MEKHAFQLLHDAEHSWWYRGRSFVVGRILGRYLRERRTEKILDLGAGFGGMLPVLKKYGTVTAQEPDAEARERCRAQGYDDVAATEDPELLPKNSFSLICAFDVLEHTPDDGAFLRLIHGLLFDDGSLVLTVPAWQWLWSEHDVLHHHYRRYSRKQLVHLLESAGFRVCYASYWNMLFFFPMAFVRLLGRSGEGALSLSRPLNALLFAVVLVESLVVPHLSLPLGTGIVVFAEKRGK
ncbi:MAG: hypothetical protein A3C93_04345 [Candidatus Lloydbacteria bacterium RIFCSPHIGHO2_02_FULL_54_17]|uniref:Methyltransferase type 11 domain-containing protein n=1 Tax=Candidatus Lloydbacteria bacterium RIFCSPHIGHO2_02_FULL_54_17 TaxID=1798664 RepID=A0A1G2DDA7_9BACT|nr:MAG: hypothetical protein A2762_05525 [Candidatus Lloydbacteria bacterium RIFCSPHIGHO2_01_FULL_54_11]OGZ11614.1 MAG: hypothetical protein A3C93_04345 [Candidatus Lloydbacteria bacterium RIFCSPHIGHO2_02_FULL_54_17]OGZ13924.1 MAG: hypothetical protein A2948_00235 [Candidatus Lloydbacteria bacterium RIFCSPLOWO2_01_FULL_54_18]OGZ16991.1 MAG: hypothetical protein A3H76_06310 [Candidatus Lloydbacteria bacterium RIFCSPLOWO2_02_FULL_54_12]